MLFFHKTDDPKARENRPNSLEDNQINFQNTENSYNMNTRITVGARTFFYNFSQNRAKTGRAPQGYGCRRYRDTNCARLKQPDGYNRSIELLTFK